MPYSNRDGAKGRNRYHQASGMTDEDLSRRYTLIDEYGNVYFRVGCQSFKISEGDEEEPEMPEWFRRQLLIALRTMLSEIDEEARK